MTLAILLEDEFGEREDGFVDVGYLLPIIETSFGGTEERERLLDYIDPWGHTVFNRLQLDRLSAELDELRKIGLNDKELKIINQFQDLIAKCKKTVHTYIKITGD